MYWNPEIETLDVESIEKLQTRKLRGMLRGQMYSLHPRYSKMMRSQGVDLFDIEEPCDLRHVPFTAQAELAADPWSFVLAMPGGRRGVLSRRMQVFYDAIVDGSQSDRKMYEYHPVMAFESYGRRTPPYRVYLAAFDKKLFKEVCGRSALCAGLSRSDRVLNAQSPGQGIGFWSVVQGSLSRGACCSSTGRPGPLEDATACASVRPNVLAGDPVYLYFMARAAERNDIRLEGIKRVLITGSPADAALKDRMAHCFERVGSSPQFADLYSVTPAKCSMAECVPGSGYHTNPDIHLWECVDPGTGEPLGPGEPGELVFTSIDGRGSVFLRYRTGDLAAGGIVYGKCPHCGRTVPRIMGPVSRREQGPDPGRVLRSLADVEGVAYATVLPARPLDGAKPVVCVTPDDTSDSGLEERVMKACNADGQFVIRIVPGSPF